MSLRSWLELFGVRGDLPWRRWRSALRLGVALAPSAYFAARVYHKTHQLGVAIGTAIACCFVVGTVLGYWIEDASWLARTSLEDWSLRPSRWRLLLEAAAAALVAAGASLLLWLFVRVMTP